MNIKHLFLANLVAGIMCISTMGQAPVVINDPAAESDRMDAVVGGKKVELTAAEQSLFDKSVLPKVREKLKSDICEETIEIAGRVAGSFTKAGAKQTLIFYQFCQTGNGLGSIGVAVIENGRVVGNFVCVESGWAADAMVLPDIDQNGLDEVALYYSWGMHQGAGGTGVEIMKFSGGEIVGIGAFTAEEFTETSPVMGYKVTAKTGKPPTYISEKMVQNSKGKWRTSGKIVPLKLKKVEEGFESVK